VNEVRGGPTSVKQLRHSHSQDTLEGWECANIATSIMYVIAYVT
jgi:hypothetical protein